MKLSEVVIGQTYYTNVGPNLVAVRVLRQRQNYENKTVFTVLNIGTDREIERSAAALRKENRKFF